jgi:hypothetical protein
VLSIIEIIKSTIVQLNTVYVKASGVVMAIIDAGL